MAEEGAAWLGGCRITAVFLGVDPADGGVEGSKITSCCLAEAEAAAAAAAAAVAGSLGSEIERRRR